MMIALPHGRHDRRATSSDQSSNGAEMSIPGIYFEKLAVSIPTHSEER